VGRVLFVSYINISIFKEFENWNNGIHMGMALNSTCQDKFDASNSTNGSNSIFSEILASAGSGAYNFN
jgi:hypothetical protein